MKRKYERAYRAEWEQDPLLSSWISKSKAKDDPDVAFCDACNCKLATFSQINLMKTKTRNRFINKHVASILHVKQGIGEHGVHGDCIAFIPTEDMLNRMNKSMYKDEETEEYDANCNV
ncbi:hypothetical protein JTB14_000929 [Gonioctena quinquepunctata]|nr:hypothetical protein JTB14_000929 [Gonioctena quinquepunctata]